MIVFQTFKLPIILCVFAHRDTTRYCIPKRNTICKIMEKILFKYKLNYIKDHDFVV